MTRRTQRDMILDLLRERGARGVSAREAVYEMGITRMAAVVFDLRGDGYDVATLDEGSTDDGRKKLARYVLRDPRPFVNREPCTCGHALRNHGGPRTRHRCMTPSCPCPLFQRP